MMKSPSAGQITAKKGVSAETIEKFIRQESRKYGVNPEIAVFVAYKESQYHLDTLGDSGHSRGLYQISDIYHPEISDECAFSLQCSTRFFMKQVLAGKLSEWSTWRLRDKLYADAIN